jgi:hypothetical protein
MSLMSMKILETLDFLTLGISLLTNTACVFYHMAGGKGDVDINDLTKKEQEAYYRYAQEIMASGELPLDQDSSVMMDYQ